jgi:hypothetical protein
MIKKLSIIIALALLTGSVFAQFIIKEKFPLTYKKIKETASKKYPDNYEMQKYLINNQCDAMNEYFTLKEKYLDIPEDDFTKIKFNAIDKWSDKKDCKIEFMEIDEYYACSGINWEMVVYTIKNQCDAYIELKK